MNLQPNELKTHRKPVGRLKPDAGDFAGIVSVAQVPHAPGQSREHVALDFLKFLFGAKPEAAYILIWQKEGKKSYWFKDLSKAAEKIAEINENVYVGVALAVDDGGLYNRCKAENTAGIVGLWIDIDVVGDAHEKTNLPRTREQALGLIPQDLRPSVLINSGHGLQGWWAFREPWIFESPDDRDAAAKLAKRFNALFKTRAAANGWDVDSVADLARVLRVPTTTNKKEGCGPCAVTVLQLNDCRYDPSELKEYLDEAGTFAPAKPAVKNTNTAGATFILNPDAEPPFDKFEMLKGIEPRLLLSWEHRRKDLQDQSPSAYDQSLANLAAIALWPDQEIVDLLIAHRRKHGVDLKLRRDYYERTLANAKETANRFWAEKKADAVLSGAEQSPNSGNGTVAAVPGSAEYQHHLKDAPNPEPSGIAHPGVAEPDRDRESDGASSSSPEEPRPQVITLCPKQAATDRRTAILDAISTKFKLNIKRVMKFTGEPGQYRIETASGSAQLGTVDGLITQTKLRRTLADATGRYLPNFDKDEWPAIAQGLLDACEEVDRGDDATLAGTLSEHLQSYLSERPPQESLAEVDESREPFVIADGVCVFITNLQSWLQVRRGERTGRNKLTADLRAYGAVPVKVPLMVEGKETSRSVWRLPPGPWDGDREVAGKR